MEESKRKELGKIQVKKQSLKIDDLENKVHFAVEAYNRAFEKYKQGADSLHDWDIVIKALTSQMEEIRDYIAVAYHNRGVIYATKGNFVPAIENFQKALSFNHDYAVCHNNLAIVYKKMGEIAKAEKHFQIAKELGFEPKRK